MIEVRRGLNNEKLRTRLILWLIFAPLEHSISKYSYKKLLLHSCAKRTSDIKLLRFQAKQTYSDKLIEIPHYNDFKSYFSLRFSFYWFLSLE